MNVLEASLMIALICIVLTIIIFIIIAYTHGDSKNFFYASQSLKSGRIANNLSATATSLAGLLLFFLHQTPTYGWVLLFVIVFIILGHLLFLKRTKILTPNPSETGSIYRFIYFRTKSRKIAHCANWVDIPVKKSTLSG